MKRLTLALLLGSVFTVGCGQSLVELPDTNDNDMVTDTDVVEAPVLTDILPQRGSVAGGTSVVLTGTRLTGATEVSFGSTAATSFTVNSSTSITAVSPPGTGSVNVTVLTAAGRSNGLPFAYGNAPVVTGLSPAFGGVAGGQSVVVTGSAFTGATSVTFGGTAATSFTVDSASQITAIAPAHTSGTVQVVVTTPVATSNGFDFAYGEAPTLVSIAPTTGLTTGGTIVTLTGTHLTGSTKVTFGTTAVTAITVIDDTHVSVATPAHAAGDVSVTVTTRFGRSAGVTFSYGVAPALTSATPALSPTAGGITVVLAGTSLLGATDVLFGTVAATSFTVVSDTEIDAVAPAGTASVNITVTTPLGTSNGLPFGYGDAPVQTSLDPSIGLVGGGTTILITGAKLTGATAVTFDLVDATSFTVDSDTQITAISPAHASGAATVLTTTPNGTSNALTFTYGAVPTLVSAAPTVGTSAGGTSVVVTGTDLNGAGLVTFGGTPAATYTVDSPTQITAVSPANLAGAVGINVTTAFGTSNAVTFTYGDTPTLASITPAAGDVGGGTNVVLSGTALDNATDVLFGLTSATSYTIDSSTQITAVLPPGTGSVNVTVTSLYGTSNGLAFAYGNAPTITSLSPVRGLVAGGETVTINGTNFDATTTVLFASGSVMPTLVSPTQITVTAPAHTAGNVNVTVANAFGTSNAATYTYGVAPTVSAVSPSAGPTAGSTAVTITGTDLVGTTSVTFGGVAGTSLIVVNSTTVTVTTPAGTTGSASVVLTTPFSTATSSFTYVDPPTIAGLTPTLGATAGGTAVTITGTNLATTTSVTFGGTAALVTIVSDTALTVTTAAHGAGSVNVVVTTAGGSATATNGYTYVSPPTVTSLSPNSGTTAGGTTVTITGTNFTTGTTVTFDGTAAGNLNVVSSTSLTVTTPAHLAGSVDVTVTTEGGSATAVQGYMYELPPGTITGSSNNPGILIGTGLAWLGTVPADYLVFSCLGNGCDINVDPPSTPTGPITNTSFNAGPGTWSGYTGAICPAGTATWDALICTNQYFSP